jgi:ferredoxin
VKLRVDPARCTCSGACAAIPGGLFVLEPDAEFAIATIAEVPEALEPHARMAITLCPSNAISGE